MAAPVLASNVLANIHISEWQSPSPPPSAYAKLYGADGFTSYMVTRSCILGKTGTNALVLGHKLGIEDLSGLQIKNIHLGDDNSIAR